MMTRPLIQRSKDHGRHRYFPLLVCLFALIACDGFQAPPDNPNAPPSKDHPESVRLDLLTLVAEAQQGKIEEVAKRFQKYLMTSADFDTLFPPAAAQSLWSGYRDTLSKDVKQQAAATLSGRIIAGYTDVSYERVGPTNHKETNRGDYALLKAMKTPARMYSFRFIKPNGMKLGFRVNGFVYVNGVWRMLLKSSAYLPQTSTPK